MSTHRLSPLLLAAALTACANDGTPVAPRSDDAGTTSSSLTPSPGCQSLGGTFFGRHVRSPTPAWVGTVLVSVGRRTMARATFVTRANEIDIDRASQGLPFRGRETATLTFSDGSIDIVADFVAIPAATPGLYQLSEAGEVVNGTGRFVGVSGRVTIQGPFIAPVDPTPLFIGEMHGSLCGLT